MLVKLTRRHALMLGAAQTLIATTGLNVGRAFAAGSIGAVESLVSDAWGTPKGGDRAALAEAANVFANELLETGDDSAADVRFVDASKLTLGANAHITVDEYVFSGANVNATLKLARGAFRYVSGTVSDKNVKIQTPTVAIGIRGTELKIDVYEDGSTEMSTVDGEAVVTSILTNEVLDVVAGHSILSDAQGIFQGGVRAFVHKSADAAIERGLSELRSRIPFPIPDLPNPFR